MGKLYKCFKNFAVNTFDNIKVVLSIVKTWLSRNINISLGCSLDSLPTKNCVSPFKQAIFEVWCDLGRGDGGFFLYGGGACSITLLIIWTDRFAANWCLVLFTMINDGCYDCFIHFWSCHYFFICNSHGSVRGLLNK